MKTEKVAIIGGGPSGLSASIYTARAGLEPIMYAGSPYGGQLMLTTEVENFPGYSSIMGPQLIETMRAQAKALGVRIMDQNITAIDFAKRPFTLTSPDQQTQFESVIIATGARALWLGLESETRLRGRGVSACATCDGFFFKNKVVAVVGGGDTAMEEALTLTKFASKVYLIHRRSEFRASKVMIDRVMSDANIEVILDTHVTQVVGEHKVEGLELADSAGKMSKLEVAGVFIAIGHKPDTELFASVVDCDPAGYILTDATRAQAYMRGAMPVDARFKAAQQAKYYYGSSTSVEGVFAAGDCVDHVYRQAATAAGLGVAAALDAERWLERS